MMPPFREAWPGCPLDPTVEKATLMTFHHPRPDPENKHMIKDHRIRRS